MGENMSFAEGRELVLSELRTSLESIDSEQVEQLLERDPITGLYQYTVFFKKTPAAD